jgi:predicted Zn-dependent peptidase
MDEKKVIDLVRKKFSFLRKSGFPGYLRVKDEQKTSQGEILHKKTEQTHFCMGIRALERDHPDRFALRLLNAVLGENMSSRLFQEIREKLGLSYDINSSVERFSDTGVLIVSGGVDIRHLPQAIEKTLEELEKMKKKIVPKRELEMAKEYCVGQTSLAVEKTSSQMVYIGESELSSGEILSIDEIIRRIRKVTAEDIQRVSRDLFVNHRLNLAVIGPVDRKEKIKNLFHLN